MKGYSMFRQSKQKESSEAAVAGNAIRVLKVDNTPQLELSTNCNIQSRST